MSAYIMFFKKGYTKMYNLNNGNVKISCECSATLVLCGCVYLQ